MAQLTCLSSLSLSHSVNQTVFPYLTYLLSFFNYDNSGLPQNTVVRISFQTDDKSYMPSTKQKEILHWSLIYQNVSITASTAI